MTGTIYSGRYRIGSGGTFTGITLTNGAAQNPATLANYIYTTSGAAILGTTGTAWTVSNQGLLIDYGMNGKAGNYGSLNNPGGIVLQSGGTVINGNAGPGGQGQIHGGGPFYADGVIEETTIGVAISGGAGLVMNYGIIKSSSTGINLAAGGTVVNGSGADSIASINAVVVVSGAAGTVLNFATIGHGGLLGGNGIDLEAGGLVINATGGYLRSGTTITGAPGTVVNAGTLNHDVAIGAGGTLQNLAGGRVLYGAYFNGSAGTLLNAGTVSGAVMFGLAGSVTNTGIISGGTRGLSFLTTGTLVNGQSGSAAGLIAGSLFGVTIAGAGALVTNFGTIAASNPNPGAGLQLGGIAGVVVNYGTVFETGGYKSAASVSLPAAGTLVNGGTILGEPFGVYEIGGSIGNTGMIGAVGIGRAMAVGVVLQGGVLVNAGTSQAVSEYAFGASVSNGGTIVNSGVLRATAVNTGTSPITLAAVGLTLSNGGTIINSGTIASAATGPGATSTVPIGIQITGTAGVSLTNFGTIAGTIGVSVQKLNGPSVTVLNAGVIQGTGTGSGATSGAVQFGNSNNRLIVQPGAVFQGIVSGGNGGNASNTLEFSAGTGTNYGVLNGLGTSVTNFGTIHVDAGADWQVSGSIGSGVTLANDGTLLANTGTLVINRALVADAGATGTIEMAGNGVAELLSSVAASQTARFIDLVGTLEIGIGCRRRTDPGQDDGIAPREPRDGAGKSGKAADLLLSIANQGTLVGTLAVVGAVAGGLAGASFAVSESGGNATITTDAPCFATGTRLRSLSGNIAVERLAVGTAMATVDGKGGTIRWIGGRQIDCRRHPQPELVWPVRIARNAFAPGLPADDLRLSPDHAVLVDGVLMPIKHLINGRSIAQIPTRQIEYWHVELERHAVLLAEGLPAESYLDTGNRAAFANGASHIRLHPDFSPSSWENACAELVQEGPRLVAAKRRFFDRAGPAPAAPIFLDVLDADRPLTPEILTPGRWRFDVAGARALRLLSPVWTPAAIFAESLDRRRLGVRLLGIETDGLAFDFDGTETGFHPAEPTAEGPSRWTDGDARIVLPAGVRQLILWVGDDAKPVSDAQLPSIRAVG